MNQKTFFLVCATVFFVVAAAHLSRLILGWEIRRLDRSPMDLRSWSRDSRHSIGLGVRSRIANQADMMRLQVAH